jgi:hypothetical protein
LQKGQWFNQSIQSESLLLGQNLGIMTFAPSCTSSADYKRQWDETNAIFNEDMVETDKSHRTKVGVTLYGGGVIFSHSHLMTTIANLYAALQVADMPNQTCESLLCIHLRELFALLSQSHVHKWINRFAGRNGMGEHLPYAIALDIHNSIIQLVMFAIKPEWVSIAIDTAADIPANGLTYYKATHRGVIDRINMACGSDNLGNYASPPSTWVSPRSKEKEALSRKSQRTDATVSPGGRPGDSRNNNSNNNNNNNNNNTTVGSTPQGSNRALGMINAPPNINNGPQLGNGQQLCMPFARRGDSCALGRNCPNAHATLRYTSQSDIAIIDNWVNRSNGVTWVTRPLALGPAQAGTQPNTQQRTGPRTAHTSPPTRAANTAQSPATALG